MIHFSKFRERSMRRSLVTGLLMLLVCTNGALAAVQVPFEAAYCVDSPGSTTPVRAFHIDGPAPWLFVDLGTSWGQYSYASSRWFSGDESTARFSANEGTWFSTERQYWLSPGAEAWEANKAVGEWRVDANYAWWTLVMTYGGGAPLTNSTGSKTVSFWVVAHPIPEPGAALVCLGAGILGIKRVRRMTVAP
jgi:hypothetical protein